MAVLTSFSQPNASLGDRYLDKEIIRVINPANGNYVFKSIDLDLYFYAASAQANEGEGQENYGLSFLDINAGLPTTAPPRAEVLVRELATVPVNGASVTLHRGDLWENVAAKGATANWQKKYSGNVFHDFPTFRGNFNTFALADNAQVLPEDYDTVLIAPDAAGGEIPLRAQFDTAGSLDVISWNLGVVNFDESFFVAKRSTVRRFVVRFNYSGDLQIVVVDLDEAKAVLLDQSGSGDADSSVSINGTAMDSAPTYALATAAQKYDLTGTGAGYLFRLQVTPSPAFTANPLNLEINSVAGDGILELAFSRDNLSPTASAQRYDVTINGLLYSSTPETGHQGANDVGWTDFPLDVPLNNEIDAITVNSGGATARRKPNTYNVVQVRSAGAASDITVTFRAIAPFNITQTSLTPQSGTPDTTAIDYGGFQNSGFLAISNVPSGETITGLIFKEQGTANVVNTIDFEIVTAKTVIINGGVTQDLDVEVVTATNVAPELRLVETEFVMVPSAADVSPSGTWQFNNDYVKRLNLKPGAKVRIVAHPIGYASGNSTYGYVVGASDSSVNLLSGGTRATVADDAALNVAADQNPWAVRLQPSVVTGARHSTQSVIVPEFTVPADGIVDFSFSPYGTFRADANGSGLIAEVRQLESVTIASTERILTEHSLTIAGATISTKTDASIRTSANTATILEQAGRDIVLDLTPGMVIGTVDLRDASNNAVDTWYIRVNEDGNTVINITAGTDGAHALTVTEVSSSVVQGGLMYERFAKIMDPIFALTSADQLVDLGEDLTLCEYIEVWGFDSGGSNDPNYNQGSRIYAIPQRVPIPKARSGDGSIDLSAPFRGFGSYYDTAWVEVYFNRNTGDTLQNGRIHLQEVARNFFVTQIRGVGKIPKPINNTPTVEITINGASTVPATHIQENRTGLLKLPVTAGQQIATALAPNAQNIAKVLNLKDTVEITAAALPIDVTFTEEPIPTSDAAIGWAVCRQTSGNLNTGNWAVNLDFTPMSNIVIPVKADGTDATVAEALTEGIFRWRFSSAGLHYLEYSLRDQAGGADGRYVFYGIYEVNETNLTNHTSGDIVHQSEGLVWAGRSGDGPAICEVNVVNVNTTYWMRIRANGGAGITARSGQTRLSVTRTGR
jgi:hypothetical protein